MAPKVPLDWQMLEQVFGDRKDILQSIKTEADSPDRVLLFNNIATYVYNKLQTPNEEPATKRRRVDIATTISQPNGHSVAPKSNGAAGSRNNESGGGGDAASEEVLLEIKDISLSAPQRKKYDLCFTLNFLYVRVSGTSAPVQGIVYPWKDIEHAFYLPVPEKAQVQHNYVLFPRNSYLPTSTGKQQASDVASDSPAALEPLVFTIPATAPKPGSILGSKASAAAAFSDSYTTLFNHYLSLSLKTAGNTTGIVSSDPKVFHSVARQSHRPSEKAVHVKAFRGSKDGYLFFLPTGVLWGFKKPLLFLPLERIVGLSFTSVLQRTFNIVIEYEGYSSGKDGGTEEIEFSMIDQEDYGEIDANYVRRHGLADRSMAEQRKAKRELAENAKRAKGEDGEEEGVEGQQTAAGDEDPRMNGMTELEKAQFMEEQRLQDEEDEDEEDYDPGSDGESEGSGSSSEEDDDDDDEDGEGGDDDDDDEGPGEDGDEEMTG